MKIQTNVVMRYGTASFISTIYKFICEFINKYLTIHSAVTLSTTQGAVSIFTGQLSEMRWMKHF